MLGPMLPKTTIYNTQDVPARVEYSGTCKGTGKDMSPLTHADILFILERIGEETVIEPTNKFRFRISKRGAGYSDDLMVGQLQAKLSIMLEVAGKRHE